MVVVVLPAGTVEVVDVDDVVVEPGSIGGGTVVVVVDDVVVVPRSSTGTPLGVVLLVGTSSTDTS